MDVEGNRLNLVESYELQIRWRSFPSAPSIVTKGWPVKVPLSCWVFQSAIGFIVRVQVSLPAGCQPGLTSDSAGAGHINGAIRQLGLGFFKQLLLLRLLQEHSWLSTLQEQDSCSFSPVWFTRQLRAAAVSLPDWQLAVTQLLFCWSNAAAPGSTSQNVRGPDNRPEYRDSFLYESSFRKSPFV